VKISVRENVRLYSNKYAIYHVTEENVQGIYIHYNAIQCNLVIKSSDVIKTLLYYKDDCAGPNSISFFFFLNPGIMKNLI